MSENRLFLRGSALANKEVLADLPLTTNSHMVRPAEDLCIDHFVPKLDSINVGGCQVDCGGTQLILVNFHVGLR